jgi:VanZ family protein
MKYRATFIISILIIMAVIIPGPNLPDVDIVGFDKFVHLGMFGMWALAIRYDFNSPTFRYLLFFLIGMTFSLFTEILQVFVEGRTFDWYDVVADAVGLLLGLPIGTWLLRYFRFID